VRACVELVAGRIDEDPGAALIAALLDDLMARYGHEDIDEPHPDDLVPPGGAFLIALLDGQPVGCGGVRLHEPGVGEIKRMYVDPAVRRQGVARALLDELERAAAKAGYARLVLETGARQPEAIALYEHAGYRPIEPYGYYQWSPLSRCFAKDLATDGR
jgi:GNAT superfamily N-acetyltransferase